MMMMMVAEEENATEPEVTALANKETEKEDAAATVITTLEKLPVEIHTDIFSRLDAKTLGRFRCVSKPFSSFISTPELISAHRLRSSKNPLLLYLVAFHDPCSYGLVSFNTATLSSSYTGISFPHLPLPVSTCLELICLTDCAMDNIAVFNPTNRYMLSLPPQPNTLCTAKSVGFGYVLSTNEYKVLLVSKGTTSSTGVVTQVFTLGTDKNWRYVEQNPPTSFEQNPPTSFSFSSPTTVGHSLYYLNDKDIVKFDLEKEEWSMLPQLPFTTGFLKELGGNLCLVDIHDDNKHIDIWMLANFDTYSWTKEFDIDLSSCLSETDNFMYALPLDVEEDGRLLISMVMDVPKRKPRWLLKLLHYNPRNKDGEYIINLDEKLLPGNNGSVIRPLMSYVDSLLSFEDRS